MTDSNLKSPAEDFELPNLDDDLIFAAYCMLSFVARSSFPNMAFEAALAIWGLCHDFPVQSPLNENGFNVEALIQWVDPELLLMGMRLIRETRPTPSFRLGIVALMEEIEETAKRSILMSPD